MDSNEAPLFAAALVVLAVVAAGCAIPTQGAPSTIANSKVPFNLMDPHPPTTTTTQPPNASYVPVKVYFLNTSDQFVPAQRFRPAAGAAHRRHQGTARRCDERRDRRRTSPPPSRAT